MYRLFFLVFGFFISVIGMSYIITYLNLISLGYSYIDYLKFIFTRFECLITFIGLFIIIIDIYMKGDIINDLCI